MKKTVSCVIGSFFVSSLVGAQPGLQKLESVISHNPFAKFGSSALDAFSGVSDNFSGLGIGTVFKRVVESNSQESPENIAYKFLRYATPLFPSDTIEQFLTSPLTIADGNSKLSSFFEQTQGFARKQFTPNMKGSVRRQLEKRVEQFDNLYGVFSEVGKNSFLDGKSPESAATTFLSQLSSFPSTAVSSFLTVPSMMQNVPGNSFFAQMRDSALQLNSNALNKRRLQLENLSAGVTDPSLFANRITDNIPFSSQFNIKDIPSVFPNTLKTGIQQIGSVAPIGNVLSFNAFDNAISEINPFNRISTASMQGESPTVADLAPSSKFFSYFRDAAQRAGPGDADERRLQGVFDLKSVQEKFAALTFENIAKEAGRSTSMKPNDAANLWLSSLSHVVPGEIVGTFLQTANVASMKPTNGPFYAKMMDAAQEHFGRFFEH